MTKLNLKKVTLAATLYVKKQHDPLNSSGYFSTYFVCVGITSDKKYFAENLPLNEAEIANDSIVIKSFVKNHDRQKIYLVKVILNKKDNILETKILLSPPE